MLPSQVYHYKSDLPGPTLVISGGVHGDEPCGVETIDFLREYFAENSILKGELYLMIVNPEAIKLNQRGVDYDINRLFLDELNPEIQGTYEHQRVEELKPILEKADYYLDLHSAGNPAKSFSVALNKTPEHTEILNVLPVEFPSYDWGEKIQGTTMGWVNIHGGVGVAVEAGWQEDPATTQIAIDCAKAFLNKLELSNFKNVPKPTFTKYLSILTSVLVGDYKTFDYAQTFDNFDPLEPGQLIATDSLGDYFADDKEALLIIFPTTMKKIRANFVAEAYLLGQLRNI